jgi:error-prone DNA polymerase
MNDTTTPFLGARTYFSLMTGAASPERVCAFAQAAGYSAVALNDANNLHGLPEFVDAAAATGLKAIAGASIEDRGRCLCRLWCLDRQGFSRLCFILSGILGNAGGSRGTDGGILGNDGGTPYDPIADLAENGWEGLAVASDDPVVLGRLAASLPGRNTVAGARTIRSATVDPDSFWSRPFVSLGCMGGSMLAARLAARLGLPVLALAGGTVFGSDDGERLRLLSAVERRITLSALPDDQARLETLTAPTASAADSSFSAFPGAVAAARRLAAEAAPAREFFASPPVFPPYRGMDAAAAFASLRSLCVQGAGRRYHPGGLGHPGVEARLQRELGIIRAKGFSSYFLVVRDIVATCPRTCGRGSAASSIVSYLLGITHVDPLAHDLFFERFLNEGRVDPPDIDVDFPWDERPAVLQRVFRDYAGRAAMVADHCRFSGRSKVREAALALGKNLDEVDTLVRAWRHGGFEALPPELARASSLLAGVPRYIGTHPGGVVITPGPIRDYSHVQPSPGGLPVLAWEKDGTERAGLVKIDLLGNRSLAVLRDCIHLGSPEHRLPGQPAGETQPTAVAPAAGEESAWEHFNPLAEPSARALIEAGNTIGIFYIESPATRQLLGKMRTADYEHLVVASSIIRPAANSYINEYVRRLHGSPWPHLAAPAEEALAETHGIMVYQEDVSRVAMAAAGFSAVEADGLRKALTKKRKGPAIPSFRERFMDGCSSRGVPAGDAEKLWDMMLSFDGYSFCKAHSASYALVSYRLAWMKANHPGVFIASVINNGGGFYGIQTYVDEAVRLGYIVLPPDVNHSAVNYEAREAVPAAASAGGGKPGHSPSRGSLRAGLMQITGLDRETACRIVAERQARGPYTGFSDFLARVKPSYDDCRVLVRSGTLDGQGLADGGLSRPAMLWVYHHWRRGAGHGAGATRIGNAAGAHREAAELFPAWRPPACIRDYPPAAKLADESSFLGVLLTVRPAALFAARARSLAASLGWPDPVPSSELAMLLGRTVSLLGVATAGKDVMASSGKLMCFRSFTDESGVFETVLFPQAYARLMPILEGNSAFLLLGVPKDDMGALAVHVDDLVALNRAPRYRG